MWNEFLPMSMPITAGELSSFRDMACSCLRCPLPAFAAGRAGARPDHSISGHCSKHQVASPPENGNSKIGLRYHMKQGRLVIRDAGGSLPQKPVARLLASRSRGRDREPGTRTLAQCRLPLAPAEDALRNALVDRIVQMHPQFGSPDAQVSQQDRALLRVRSRLP